MTLKIGYYQFRPLFGQVQKNLSKVISVLNDVDADLIVLPELAFTGYYHKDRREALSLAEDPFDSEITTTLTRLCKDKKMHIVTGFSERNKDKVFNSALLISPGGVSHVYRKLHLFNTEKKWFNPGDTPLSVQKVKGIKIGIMICFDWIFPEVMRNLAIQGAHIICHPSNLVMSYCQQAMLTRCLENGVFAITANRFGTDNRPSGSIGFTGKSQIVNPKGEILHRAYSQREELKVIEIDPSLSDNKNITTSNHLINDRRPEFYSALWEQKE